MKHKKIEKKCSAGRLFAPSLSVFFVLPRLKGLAHPMVQQGQMMMMIAPAN